MAYSSDSHAQPYANNWTEITDGGDTIYHTWPPPDSIWLQNQIVIKFTKGVLDYSKLCYNCDTIDTHFGSGTLTPDSPMYFPACKETLMTEEFDTSVILNLTLRSILKTHGLSYLRRMTAANPCADTLSITRLGDTIPMDDFDWMIVQLNNDTGVLSTLAALYAPGSSGIEIAEPIYLMQLAHTPRTPNDPWAYLPPYNAWPYNQISLNTLDWEEGEWGIGMPTAWGYDVGSTSTRKGLIVSVIDNGIDYWRCDLGGETFPNKKVVGGWDYNGNSGSSIYLGTCRIEDDHGAGASNHGTPIAAIIGAYTNNEGCGVTAGLPTAMAGIAGGWETVGGATNLGTGVGLVGYNVIDPTSCGISTQSVNSTWAASAIMESSTASASGLYGYGASVINASWYLGPNASLLAIRTAVSEAFNNKVSFVACTGNLDRENVYWPACIEPASEVIAVGATGKAEGESDVAGIISRADYSNYNHYTDLVAPGGILSPDPYAPDYSVYSLEDDILDGPTYASSDADAGTSFSGTSVAAPHVAGVTALLRDYLQTGGYMGDPTQAYSFEDIEGILKASALDFGYNPASPPAQPPTDPWCCPHPDPDGVTNYTTGFDEEVGWGFLQAGQMFTMLDPAVLGYKLYHYEIEPADVTYGTWSAKTPIYLYNPYGPSGTNPPTGPYKAEVREVYGNKTYSGFNTSLPIYAWGTSTPKDGWANLTSVGGLGWSNWEENWTEVKMDSHVPTRDYGNGIVPGIRHDYSSTFTAHTWQYLLFNLDNDTLGIYPNHAGISLDVTIFGVPCTGCKIADGSQDTIPTKMFRVWPPIASSTVEVMMGGDQLTSQFMIVDALGRIVREQDVSPNTQQFEVPTADLQSGLYLARLISGNEIEQAKFVVRH